MPQPKRSARSQSLPYHPLVEALASDPNQPPKQATRLFGYPGPAADAKSTRLWLDPELSSYVDIPDDSILHSRTLPEEEGTIVWVDPAATLTHSVPAQQEVQAEFLAGSITEANLAGAAEARMKPPGTIGTFGPTRTIGTIATIYPTYADTGCPRSYIACETGWGSFCSPFRPTWIDICGDVGLAGGAGTPAQHTAATICPSIRTICPTVLPICEHVGSLKFQSQLHPCITQQQICTHSPICVASGGGTPCPTGPWTGTTTPVIDQVGPFRAQF